MKPEDTHGPPFPDEDAPLDDDDVIVQRYLDGTLPEEESLLVERRIQEDSEFASRVHGYEALFAVLDSSALARACVLWGAEMPRSVVEAAVSRWEPGQDPPQLPADEPAASGLEQVFGGWRPAAVAFFLADLALAGMLGMLALTRGPMDLLRTWAIGGKDIALWLAEHGPAGGQLAVVLPITATAAIAGLFVVRAGMRTVRARARVQG